MDKFYFLWITTAVLNHAITSYQSAMRIIQLNPQTIAGELFDRISLFANSALLTPSEIEVYSLKRDARKLLKADVVQGHLANAAIAAVCWDLNSMNHHYDCASRLRDDPIVNASRAVGSQTVLMYSQAADFAVKAYNLDRLDQGAARQALTFLLSAGRISECKELYIESAKTFGDELVSVSPIEVAGILQSKQISEETVARLQETVCDFLREKRIRPTSITMQSVLSPEDSVLSIAYELDLPLPEVLKLDRDLTDRLFDSVECMHLNHLWIGLQPSAEVVSK